MPTRPRALRPVLALLGAIAVGVTGTAGAAEADDRRTAPHVSPETGGILAQYEGRTIDLSQGWQGADNCVEQLDGGFNCYDNEADYLAGENIDSDVAPRGSAECKQDYLCLWDYKLFEGRRVQFIKTGVHKLAEVDFYNKASSVYNRRNGWAHLVADYEHTYVMGGMDWASDLSEVYTVGDHFHFNNRVGEVKMTVP